LLHHYFPIAESKSLSGLAATGDRSGEVVSQAARHNEKAKSPRG
jgi:hypothetical protein